MDYRAVLTGEKSGNEAAWVKQPIKSNILFQ
jgi:hypothetical protein